MKICRILSLTLTLLLLLPALALPASATDYVYEEPVKPEDWEEPDFSTDHAYSIAFVGDPQFISTGDVYTGTKKMDQLFGYIAETAEERKLEQVFVLGDITQNSYHNDGNLATSFHKDVDTAEWENAQKAILQLSEAGVNYSLCRGNHDDYMIDDYFNIPAYTDQFKENGGFFCDPNIRYTNGRESRNSNGYVHWSALSGKKDSSIVNSYRTAEICGTKYIFITMDFNPHIKVVNWLDELLTEYSDHLAIIATHAFIDGKGDQMDSYKGDTSRSHGNTPSQIWTHYLSKHANVLFIVSGHKHSSTPVVSGIRGENGNVVRQVLVDHQSYDTLEQPDGTIVSGTQDTGMVLYMNFSEDGKTVTFDYYSTLLNKEKKDSSFTLDLYEQNPALKALADKEAAATVTESASSGLPQELGGQGNVAVIVAVSCGAVVLILAALLVVHRIRKKKAQ